MPSSLLRRFTGDLESVLREVEERLRNEEFSVINRFPLTDSLRERGFEHEFDVLILDVCNPEIASLVLRGSRELAPILPCRLALVSNGEETEVHFLDVSELNFPEHLLDIIREPVSRIKRAFE